MNSINSSTLTAWNPTAAEDRPLPYIIRVNAHSPRETSEWLVEHAYETRAMMSHFGAVLLRGLSVKGAPDFRSIFVAILGAPMPYAEKSSPRKAVYDNVYSSTEYRNDRSIFLHNEQSYNNTFVRHIAFYCATAAATGGETPLADTRKVFARIDPILRSECILKGYIYRRAFGFGLGPSWQDTFGLTDVEDLEEYCEQNKIQYTWMSTDRQRLVTEQKRAVAARHPISGESTWFNHMTFFHVLNLEPELRALLETVCRKDEFPHSTLFGDGTEIHPRVINIVREAYLAEEVTFDWMVGDILLIDNMLVAHGRRPFTGPRQVMVAMSSPTRWEDVAL